MTLLDRLRRWLFGGEETEESEPESASEESDEQRLDPDNVTQTRSTSDDAAVSQLQELKQTQGEDADAERE